MRIILVTGLMLLFPSVTLAHEGGAVPADVWTHWNTDPLLLTALLLPLYVYQRGTLTYPVKLWRTAAFTGGLFTLFVALISPLEALSGALFSGHMIQHLLLVLIAALLLVVSRPTPILLRGLPGKFPGHLFQLPLVRQIRSKLSQPLWNALLHIAVLWVWHLPSLYSAALNHGLVHIFQHVCFLGTGVLFWEMILHTGNHGERILAVFAVMMTTGLLGALMTFSTAPWYTNHSVYASAWGLTLLEDQQLAGLFMWIPPGVIYVITAGFLLAGWINAVEQKMLKRERQWAKEIGDA